MPLLDSMRAGCGNETISQTQNQGVNKHFLLSGPSSPNLAKHSLGRWNEPQRHGLWLLLHFYPLVFNKRTLLLLRGLKNVHTKARHLCRVCGVHVLSESIVPLKTSSVIRPQSTDK